MAKIEKAIMIQAPVAKVFAFMAEPVIQKMNEHEADIILANLKARMEAWPEPGEAAGRLVEVF